MGTIAQNLALVNEKIALAAQKSGRKREDITLVAVSKTKPMDMVLDAFGAGQADFGENRVQELMEKQPQLCGARWHLIGHLQTNKVKYVLDKACLVHSVDSLRLAEEISKRAKAQSLVCPVLLEINVSGEQSKFGLTIDETPYIIEKIEELENIKVKGLMTVAPKAENGGDVRYVFERLRALYERLGAGGFQNTQMQFLSMGMSGDFEAAILEGSNMVRVGSAIFGSR